MVELQLPTSCSIARHRCTCERCLRVYAGMPGLSAKACVCVGMYSDDVLLLGDLALQHPLLLFLRCL